MRLNLHEAESEINFLPWKRIQAFLVSILLIMVVFSCEDASPSSEEKPVEQTPPTGQTLEKTQEVILFFGNSITAGYQLNPDDAFPALIQRRLDSLGYDEYQVVNGGISGETSAAGLTRIDWAMRQPVSIFVLELGANDGLRGLSLEETRDNLTAILSKVRETHPDAHLVVAGMQIPPNMGPDYTKEFREIFPALAREFDATLIPFLLEGVAGEPELNLSDGIHPTEAGHRILAETVWKSLEPLLAAPTN